MGEMQQQKRTLLLLVEIATGSGTPCWDRNVQINRKTFVWKK